MAECSIVGCTNPTVARGLCRKHYSRWYKTGSPLGKQRQRNICKIEGCVNFVHSHGLCATHSWRLKRYGDPCKGWTPAASTSNPYTYSSYQAMKGRCLNPKSHGYYNYGGRGIKICNRWLGTEGFDHFLEDMGPRPIDMTLDRIDSDGDYCPENCRWADWKTQGSNRRGLALITYRGETHPLKEWSKILNISYPVLVQRKYYGWSVKKMFEQPVRKRNNLKQ